MDKDCGCHVIHEGYCTGTVEHRRQDCRFPAVVATVQSQAETIERNFKQYAEDMKKLEQERDAAIAEFKIACRTIADMETRDPDKRIAELETALNELNDYDAPEELVKARQERDALAGELARVKSALLTETRQNVHLLMSREPLKAAILAVCGSRREIINVGEVLTAVDDEALDKLQSALQQETQ